MDSSAWQVSLFCSIHFRLIIFFSEPILRRKQMKSIEEDFYCQKQIGMVLSRQLRRRQQLLTTATATTPSTATSTRWRRQLPRKMASIKRRDDVTKRKSGIKLGFVGEAVFRRLVAGWRGHGPAFAVLQGLPTTTPTY